MSPLLELFAGEWVFIVCKSLRGTQAIADTVTEGNVVVSGTLVDETDEFYLLDSTGNGINEAILKSDVIRMYTSEPEYPIDEDVPPMEDRN